VNLSTIAAARYAVHQLIGVKNDAVIEQVLAEQSNRFVDDPRQSTYEDSPLPDTPEVRSLTDQVTGIMHAIDPRLEPSPFWAHILQPGESTMYHTHRADGRQAGRIPGRHAPHDRATRGRGSADLRQWKLFSVAADDDGRDLGTDDFPGQ
jgi:hypothetical protein